MDQSHLKDLAAIKLASPRNIDLRDWFAGLAMAGMWNHDFEGDASHLAALSYEVADVMMVERAKSEAGPLEKQLAKNRSEKRL